MTREKAAKNTYQQHLTARAKNQQSMSIKCLLGNSLTRPTSRWAKLSVVSIRSKVAICEMGQAQTRPQIASNISTQGGSK